MRIVDYRGVSRAEKELKTVANWVGREEVSVNELEEIHDSLRKARYEIDFLETQVSFMKEMMAVEDWRLFIETLPVLENYAPGQESIEYNDSLWQLERQTKIHSHPAWIYRSEDCTKLHVFEGGYFLDNGEWGPIDCITREEMGFTDKTKYKKTTTGIKAISSGYIDMEAYIKAATDNYTKPLDYVPNLSDFTIPIIDRSHQSKAADHH